MGDVKEFWISNVSKYGVSLRDLDLIIQPRKSMNLLSPGHFHYTLEQLQLSAKSGSLYKKRDKIMIRLVGPKPVKFAPGVYVSKIPVEFKNKIWSQIKIHEDSYEELNISESEFIDQITNDEDE